MKKQDGTAKPYKNQVLNRCNTLLKWYPREIVVSNFRTDFPSSLRSAQLNGLNIPVGPEGMLEVKYYPTADMGFPFITAFIEKAYGCIEDGLFTTVNKAYSSLVKKLLNRNLKDML